MVSLTQLLCGAGRRGAAGARALVVCWGAVVVGAGSSAACAEDVATWPALTDVALTSSSPKNALDFSALRAPGAAGAKGWVVPLAGGQLGFERAPAAQRFLAASMVFGAENGGVPDKDGASRLVQELARTGYNLVRLHFVDAQLMEGRKADFDFEPEQFNRLQFLLAELKSAGIYWLVDGMTSDNGAYGAVFPHRYVKRYHAKLDVLLSDDGFRHWATLVDRIWGVRNPYTGIAPLNDPAMLGMILVNEGSIAFMATIDGGRYPEVLAAPFRDWLRQHYPGDTELRAAWGASLAAGESLDKSIALPAQIRGTDPRDIDFARFVRDTERRAARRMDDYVRSKGFGGLTMAFDNWAFLGEDLSRSETTAVDMHGYHAIPTLHGLPGSQIAQTSLFDTYAQSIRSLTNARQWGKPFLVSEYGQPFWNGRRYEMPAMLSAMASHQGWAAICQFAETPIQFDYRPSPLRRRNAIFPYGVGADPIARASERLAAQLFLRGDVAPSAHRVRLHVDAQALFGRRGGWEQVPEALSRLAFVAPVGLDWGPMPQQAVPGELSVDLMAGPSTLVSRLVNAAAKAGWDFARDGVDSLRGAGIIDASNASRPQANFYESDTGQMVFDFAARRFTVGTKRTDVAIVERGDATAGDFKVSGATAPALFAVSSLDGEPLVKSRRMLVWVLTDAVNTDMRFRDAERTTLAQIGHFPPRVKPVAVKLSWRNAGARSLHVWPLSLAGDRRAPLAVGGQGQAVELSIDTAALPDGPALYFEVAVE